MQSAIRVLRLGLLLQNPSAHQVDLLTALRERSDVDVFVGYAFGQDPGRSWGRPVPQLRWEVMPAGPVAYLSSRVGAWLDAKRRDVWIVASNYTALATHVAVRHLCRMGACWGYLAEPPRRTSLPKRLVRRWLLPAILKRAHGVAGTGAEACRRYRKLVAPHTLTASIPYYQSLDVFEKLPLPDPPEPGLPVRFVNVSQLIPRKGLFCLLEACSLLPRAGWTLDLYGKGRLAGKLVRQVLSRRLPVRLCGVVPYAQRWKMFQGHHCFVFSSLHDGWGMAVPEALAAGLPAISTNAVMSAHEFIRNGDNGFIGPARDPQFLAGAMRHYVECPSRLAAAGIHARESVAHYHPAAGAERVVRFARDLQRASGTSARRLCRQLRTSGDSSL